MTRTVSSSRWTLALGLLTLPALAVPTAAQSGPVLHSSDGTSFSQAYGGILSECADIDGDDIPEVIVGCQEYGFGSGRVRVLSGADGSVIHQWSLIGHGDGVADAGDVDNDGVTDILVGDLFSSPNFGAEGTVWVYSGATGTELYRWDGGGNDRYLGDDVAGLGDINGDGHGDVLMGAWGEFGEKSFSGVAYVRSGLDGSVIYRIEGTVDHGYFGESVAGIDDVDDDGIPDFAIGAVGEDTLGSNTGAVYLYSGATGTLIDSWTGPVGNARFGDEVRSAGDVDGDGKADLVIAARFVAPNGQVFVISGATGETLATFAGYDPDEVFGTSVDGAGDVDGDGLDDIIVGSDQYYDPAGYTGFVRVYSVATGKLLSDFRAGSPTARLGYAVAGVGDVNGDGVPDFAAGAITQDTPAGNDSGRAYVFSGALTGIVYEVRDFDAGATATFRVNGATPGSALFFAASLTGEAPLPTPFGVVNLSPPIILLPFVVVGASGEAELEATLPPGATGLVMFTQAVELFGGGGGQVSHPLQLEMH